MAQIIRATEFVRSFSDIMNRVDYKGKSFDLQKGNHIVARITPAEIKPSITVRDLEEAFKNGPHLDPEDADQCMKNLEEIRRNTKQDIKKLVEKWD
ncbi:antitoxin [Rickettsia rhipicephali]|uniref:type II toxin-antitoxin system antitoxin VapB n=1 Tax=Rickettsia rhipicephali TaxID=33992 RepID=UPI0022533A48|nr:antitoxin [Rickettsia rhipicephali]MCX4079430.1 antitoxin [Rickettsia rhipicephali]